MSKDISSGETSKIYFGKVMDVKDDKYIFRVRVAIPGYTDKLAVEDLPLYFPWYGVNFLPLVNFRQQFRERILWSKNRLY